MAKELTREFFKKQGKRGGKASAKKLTPEQRSASAKRAALARWSKNKDKPKSS